MQIVSVYSDKGGVGKTTISLQVATALALTGKKVLLIDNDPQGSLSGSCAADINTINVGMDSVYSGEKSLINIITDSFISGLFLAPAGLKLRSYYLNNSKVAQPRIQGVMDFIKTNPTFVDVFDFVIVDNPPAQDGAALYWTLAADKIVIPVIPDELCYDALVRSYALIKEQSVNFSEKMVLIVAALVKNRAVHRKYLDIITQKYNGINGNTLVSQVRVGDRAEVPESIDNRQNLFISHASSESAAQFKTLCLEIFPWIDKEKFFGALDQAAQNKRTANQTRFAELVRKRRLALANNK
ncbi:MAG: ParA family protein [Chitinispirillales bacterium]|jgi:cellulose biosynthesis protein BcsQ|nr:ParA family protein [Chitinispirillales bacterium]